MDCLPTLTDTPTRQSSSCASVSFPLMDFLDATLPQPPALTLSVGCGAGLLEALLLQRHPHRGQSLVGVEVQAQEPVIKFLPEQAISVVSGTWAVAIELDAAEGLLFVYPRSASLVREYLSKGERVQTVIWIGPQCDADEFKEPMAAWAEEAEQKTSSFAGNLVEPGELVLIFRRRSPT